MIRDATFMCAQKLTIYCTEPKTKKWKKENAQKYR